MKLFIFNNEKDMEPQEILEETEDMVLIRQSDGRYIELQGDDEQ